MLSNTNITIFNRGMLSFQDWIDTSRNVAVAASFRRQASGKLAKEHPLAMIIRKHVPEDDLNTYLAQKDGGVQLAAIEQAASNSNAEKVLFKALELVRIDPSQAEFIGKNAQKIGFDRTPAFLQSEAPTRRALNGVRSERTLPDLDLPNTLSPSSSPRFRRVAFPAGVGWAGCPYHGEAKRVTLNFVTARPMSGIVKRDRRPPQCTSKSPDPRALDPGPSGTLSLSKVWSGALAVEQCRQVYF